MASKLDGHAVRVKQLAAEQARFLDAFLQLRCAEETDLDFQKLKRSCGGYIEWCAMAMEAAAANLAKRRWNSIAEIVEQSATDGLANARKTPVEGKKRIPSLLSSAFFQNDFLNRISNEEAPLLEADLKGAMQTGIVLLSEAEAQAIDESVRVSATMAVLLLLAADVQSAGPGSLKVAPENLRALKAVVAGGREISDTERRLSGNWVYQEFYGPGRSELHMLLLGDGHCVRSGRTVASLTFRDSSGNWTGFADAVSGIDPGEYGKWRFDGRLLNLEMEDSSAYEYEVTLSGTSMTTRNTTGGVQRYWTKGR